MDKALLEQLRAKMVIHGVRACRLPLMIVDTDGQIALASGGTGDLLAVNADRLPGRPFQQYLVEPAMFEHCRAQWGEQDNEPRTVELRSETGNILRVEIACSLFSIELPAGEGDRRAAGERSYLMLALTDVHRREHEDELRAVRLAKLSLLNQVSEALYGANLNLDQVLQAVLICITAGQGLRFNRAFLMLVDEASLSLRGEIAIGPSNADEASRIWMDLADQASDLFEMMTSYDRSIKQTDVAVNEIVRNMVVPLDQEKNVLVQAMRHRHALRVSADQEGPGLEALRGWLGCAEFAIAPLTTRSGPVGIIVADNAINRREIADLDLEFLQLFANQSAGAIENTQLYQELEKRLIDLRKAHQQQKEDQATLLRMERLSVMGETSAIVAHELRNPLVAIGGFARTLTRNLEEDDPNRQFASIISDEVGRMERIIHDLLDFIRPRKSLRKTVVIDELIRDTVASFAGEIEDQNRELTYDLKAGELALSCHPGEIRQVLQNFLMNGLQATGPGGQLEVGSEILEGGVKIIVSDNGPGFAEDTADKLFAPFFSTKTTGSGLGLTICAQIIKSHGGVIGAGNRAQGGAEFHIILPLPKD